MDTSSIETNESALTPHIESRVIGVELLPFYKALISGVYFEKVSAPSVITTRYNPNIPIDKTIEFPTGIVWKCIKAYYGEVSTFRVSLEYGDFIARIPNAQGLYRVNMGDTITIPGPWRIEVR